MAESRAIFGEFPIEQLEAVCDECWDTIKPGGGGAMKWELLSDDDLRALYRAMFAKGAPEDHVGLSFLKELSEEMKRRGLD